MILHHPRTKNTRLAHLLTQDDPSDLVDGPINVHGEGGV